MALGDACGLRPAEIPQPEWRWWSHSWIKGTCYRVVNWRLLGRSEGRRTKSKQEDPRTSIKELWAYKLGKDFRQRLLSVAV